ncbi:hypothetical protein PISL3812_08804 [Talaromyces islandicus]|uniref:Borealin N-terminal domain-containing protein n=1 Tax=Talaromyces islandicus TaxID=28573 RepID=A0A0U1M8T5_TALIS|nr:hypothetical protein PISL3812_08804 [Talaromyces islandicus]
MRARQRRSGLLAYAWLELGSAKPTARKGASRLGNSAACCLLPPFATSSSRPSQNTLSAQLRTRRDFAPAPRSIRFSTPPSAIFTTVSIHITYFESTESATSRTMSTAVSRKRKSPETDRHTQDESQITTPTGSPPAKKLRITQTQKQTLIDNLQLEITERARKLRAQYALQAQDLRSRIERRVNRIPVSLRKLTMGALLEKYSLAQSPKKSAAPAKTTRSANTTIVSRDVEYPKLSAIKSPSRHTRQESNVGSHSDKENAPLPEAHLPLENPKKRGNPSAAGQPRSVSQVLRDAESKVLSPKSSNSRTYKQSPLITSPTKTSYLSRPASPLKPSSPLKAMIEDARARTMRPETKKTSPAGGRKTKTTTQTRKTTTKSAKLISSKSPARPATRQQDRHISTSTTSSNMSSGTTIVRPTRTATAKRGTATTSSAAAKRTTVARSQGPTAAATAKRMTAAAKKAAETPTSNTGRVLRKRA